MTAESCRSIRLRRATPKRMEKTFPADADADAEKATQQKIVYEMERNLHAMGDNVGMISAFSKAAGHCSPQ